MIQHTSLSGEDCAYFCTETNPSLRDGKREEEEEKNSNFLPVRASESFAGCRTPQEYYSTVYSGRNIVYGRVLIIITIIQR